MKNDFPTWELQKQQQKSADSNNCIENICKESET